MTDLTKISSADLLILLRPYCHKLNVRTEYRDQSTDWEDTRIERNMVIYIIPKEQSYIQEIMVLLARARVFASIEEVMNPIMKIVAPEIIPEILPKYFIRGIIPIPA